MIRPIAKHIVLTIVGALMFGMTALAQTSISGSVIDSQTNEPLLGVSILVKGKVIGTISDTDGNFSLNVASAPPLTLVFSMVGYTPFELDIDQANMQGLQIPLEESAIMGQEVVVSASRVEESVMQSPVAVEKMDILAVRETAAPSFYDALQGYKGVDLSSQSLTFRSINMRGFGANGNERIVQLIDGIDNQAPGLNFSVGNIVGINDLDVESVEMLPGASSALYGPNALNGVVLMKSKSPFEYQGFSGYSKLGVTHVKDEDMNPSVYQDYGMRYAKAFNNKWAMKLTASYLIAQDFIGEDNRDQSSNTNGLGEGFVVETPDRNRQNNRSYNGVNVYGDFGINFNTIYAASQNPDGSNRLAGVRSLLPTGADGVFSPTGYSEQSFVDNTTESLKLGTALHYRINDDIVVLGQFNWGKGATVYTANDRFVLDGFSIWTAKAEIKGANFYGRVYTTQEASGDSYAADVVASRLNQELYLPDYTAGFIGARSQGATVDQSHQTARAYADQRQQAYLPGTPLFVQKTDSIKNLSIFDGGAKFLDNSNMYHAEGGYNFSDYIDWADVQVGANFRQYNLKSEGTLFAREDNGDEQSYNEYGGYLQVTKRFLSDNLKLQASGRYDKNQNFEGQFSPRVSVVGTIAQDHNIRGSYQKGFRIPTAQDQFIDLDVSVRRLIGSNQLLVDRYNFKTNTAYSTQSLDAARNASTSADARAALSAGVVNFDKELTTEKISTYETGYRGLFLDGKLMMDAYYYHSFYSDFIAEITFIQAVQAYRINEYNPQDGFNPVSGFDPSTDAGKDAIIANNVEGGQIQEYGFDINADGIVESHGWGVQLDYSLNGGYRIGGNVSYDDLLDDKDLIEQGFRAEYNTPKYKYNVSFANREVIENLGFNVKWRWQQAFFWDSSYGTGVIPEFGTLDAQVSYKLTNMKSILKLGGSNVLNKRYTTSFGNPRMGALYYVSLTFDEFLN